ncbi:hypothetical protein HanIR_Chr01g0031951 [Helianthus annuus]|nr:hypothetical protein HanIR_Chr01g0031951 [Helianthus annuus]
MVSDTSIYIKFTKLGIFSVLTFSIQYGTGIHRILHSNTGTEPYRVRYIRFRYPLLGIFGNGILGNGIFGNGWYRAHQIL